jgi:hypothetical protein
MKLGITGHQQLEKYNLEWIKESILSFLIENEVEQGFTSLALGADQLFAKLLLKRMIPFQAIIPCSGYEATFKKEAHLLSYKQLLSQATHVYYLPFKAPSEKAFYEAGKKIVSFSDILIAIWDGQKAKGLGGTADIVTVAMQESKKVMHINPLTLTKTIL